MGDDPEQVPDHGEALLLATATAAQMLADQDWIGCVDDVLRLIGEAAGVDRVLMFQVAGPVGAETTQRCIAEWGIPGSMSLVAEAEIVSLISDDPLVRSWCERRRKGEMIFGLTRDLTGFIGKELTRQGVVAHLSVPIMVEGRWWGHVALDDCREPRRWSRSERQILAATAALLSSAIKRSITQDRLSDEQALAKTIVHHALTAIITSDEEGRIVEFNPAAESMFGIPRGKALGRSISALIIPPEQREPHERGMKRHRAGHASTLLDRRVEVEGLRNGADRFPLELTVTAVESGSAHTYVAHLRDISQSKRNETRLKELAFNDAVTGLANRAGLLAAMDARDDIISLMVVEATALEEINTVFGSRFADAVLRSLGKRIEIALPIEAFAARVSDRGLAIALPTALDSDANDELVRRIHALLTQPFQVHGRRLHLAARIGQADRGTESPDSVLRDAELAASHAVPALKPVAFSDALRDERVTRLELEGALREGMKQPDQFTLQYQPILALGTNRIAGMEALVRWNHPERGRISPADFIPLAEATGLIVPLGEALLREAVRFTLEMPETSRPISVAVNLSPVQLTDPALVPTVKAVLEETGLPASRLKFEITETAVMEQPELAVEVLHALRDLGIILALDDFGTGYSSLAMLRDLPVSILKIDRSFVSAMARSVKDEGLVARIIDVALTLDLDTVAEGIETKEEVDRLISLGCTHGQGFHLGRPMDPADALTRIRSMSGTSPVLV